MKKISTIFLILSLIGFYADAQHFDISKVLFDNISFSNKQLDSTYAANLNYTLENYNLQNTYDAIIEIIDTKTQTDNCALMLLNSCIFLNTEDFKTALKEAINGRKIAEKKNQKNLILSSDILLSIIYSKMESIELSNQSLLKCKTNMPYELYQIKWTVAANYAELKNFKEAYNYQKEVVNLSKDISFVDCKSAYTMLTKYAESLGDYENALEAVLSEDSLITNYNGQNFKNPHIIYRKNIENYEGYLTIQKIIILNDLGYLYRKKGDYEKAEMYLKESILLANNTKNKEYLSVLYANIGLTFTLLKKYKEADAYYKRALNLYLAEANELKLAETYNLSAKNKFLENNPQEAVRACGESISIGLKRNFLSNLSASYFILSEIYTYYGDYQNSQKYYKLFSETADAAKKRKNDKINSELKNNLISQNLSTDFEKEIAEKERKDLEIIALKLESEQKEQELLLLKSENNLKEKILVNQNLEKEKALKSLALISAQLEKEKIAKNNDILTKEKELGKLEEVNLKNKISLLRKESEVLESEKKVKEVELLAKNKQQNLLASGLAIAAIALSFMIFLANKTRKQKKLITLKNISLTSLSETLSASNNQLESSIQEIENQKSIIQEKNIQIVESISYAQRIQDSFLVSEHVLSGLFQSAFVLFKPKDIVSGDFYFAKQINKKLYFAIGDSTGHGVPGSMISIIGLNELNHIIDSDNRSLSDMLTELNYSIYGLLNSKSNRIGSDGIDLMLMEIDLENRKIKLAGARGMATVVLENTFIDIKGDRTSIGEIHDHHFVYTEHTFDYQKGDFIYLYTDGFYDQIGGEKHKKIGSIKFKSLLNDINKMEITEQKRYLENYFVQWQCNNKQLDDIAVVALQLL